MSQGPILVTGAAGFIGMHVARRLLESGWAGVGVDDLNAYYDPRLKEARLGQLVGFGDFRFEKVDIADRDAMTRLFAQHRFLRVVHLAAPAGVRHSLVEPHAYVDANLVPIAGICFTPHRRRFTASIQAFHFAPPTTWTIHLISMARQKRQTN
jgi:UDP-glucuronate 4-epimerase